ncbi:MAG: type IA DNA topoisomerase [Thermoprotei archaeon]|nr:MAG: type IA DNA topoisomerase [Thermoprotei archaeon]
MDYDIAIIAEKHSVAKAFAQLLASKYQRKLLNGVPLYEFEYRGFRCVSLGISGHLMDFDFPKEYNSWKAVDPSKLFLVQPVQVLRKGSGRFVKAIGELSKRSREMLLALDSDVEGESIAFEVMKIAKRFNPSIKFKRAWFSAITREELKKAFEKPKMPDEKLANKAFARMIADLTIGAAFTRALTLMVENKGKFLPRGRFISYGPCQTPVLYLVVKRALERERFKKEKYYILEAHLEFEEQVFKAKIKGQSIKSIERAKELYSKLSKVKSGDVVVSEYKDALQSPPEPLNTIELERRGSRFLNIRPKETLDIAEELYRESLISYPRTETTIYPPSLDLRKLVSNFLSRRDLRIHVKEILEGKLEPTRGKEDDRAHPPIYPIRDVKENYVRKRFGDKGWRIYDFVVRHFLATFSKPAVLEIQRAEIKIGDHLFVTEGRKIVEEGYLKVYPYERPTEQYIPYMLEGDEVRVIKINLLERETKPPPYLSESELLRLMRKYGIGTDATMQDHIQTNIERRYFKVVRKSCIPTPLGKALAVTLYETVPEVVMPEVRGRMEKELVKIAEGLSEPSEVISNIKEEFLEYFKRLVEKKDVVSQRLIEAVKQVYDKGNGKEAKHKIRSRKGKDRGGRKAHM